MTCITCRGYSTPDCGDAPPGVEAPEGLLLEHLTTADLLARWRVVSRRPVLGAGPTAAGCPDALPGARRNEMQDESPGCLVEHLTTADLQDLWRSAGRTDPLPSHPGPFLDALRLRLLELAAAEDRAQRHIAQGARLQQELLEAQREVTRLRERVAGLEANNHALWEALEARR